MIPEIVISVALSTHVGFENKNLNYFHPSIQYYHDKCFIGAYYNSERRVSFYTGRNIYSGIVNVDIGLASGYKSYKMLPMLSISKQLDNNVSLITFPSIDSKNNKPGLVLGISYNF